MNIPLIFIAVSILVGLLIQLLANKDYYDYSYDVFIYKFSYAEW